MTQAYLLPTGQSNMLYVWQSGQLQNIVASVKTLLGWGSSDSLTMLGGISGPEQTIWAATALSPAAPTGNPSWLNFANGFNASGGFVRGTYQTLVHNYLAALPGNVKAAPIVLLIGHTESDSSISNLTVSDAQAAYQFHIADIAAALGKSPSGLPTILVPVPYDFAGNQGTSPGNPTAYQILHLDQSAQNVRIALQNVADNPAFYAKVVQFLDDSDMNGTDPNYGGQHFSSIDLLNLPRLTRPIAASLQGLANIGSVASSSFDWTGPQVSCVATVVGQPNKLDLRVTTASGAGLQALSTAASAGAGWMVRNDAGTLLYATSAILVTTTALQVTFASSPSALGGSARLYYPWGDGRICPNTYTAGHNAAVYDTNGLPVSASVRGVAIESTLRAVDAFTVATIGDQTVGPGNTIIMNGAYSGGTLTGMSYQIQFNAGSGGVNLQVSGGTWTGSIPTPSFDVPTSIVVLTATFLDGSTVQINSNTFSITAISAPSLTVFPISNAVSGQNVSVAGNFDAAHEPSGVTCTFQPGGSPQSVSPFGTDSSNHWFGVLVAPTVSVTTVFTLFCQAEGPNNASVTSPPFNVTPSVIVAPTVYVYTPDNTHIVDTTFPISGSYQNGTPTSMQYQFSSGGAVQTVSSFQTTPVDADNGGWSGQAIAPAAPGSYTVTVTSGSASAVTFPFTINPVPVVPTISINTPNNTHIVGETFTITGAYSSGTPAGLTYQFSGGGSPSAVTVFQITAIDADNGSWSGQVMAPGTPGTSYTLTVTSTSSSATDVTNPFTINPITTPSLFINTPNNTHTVGNPLMIRGTYNNGTPAGLQYQFSGGGALLTVSNFIITAVDANNGRWSARVTAPGTPGSYTVTVTSTSSPATATTNSFTINALVNPTIHLNTPDNTHAVGNAFTITGTYSNGTPAGLTYQFSGGGSLSVGSFSITPVDANNGSWSGQVTAPGTAGSYTITITSTSSAATDTSAPFTVNPQSALTVVNPNNQPPATTFTLSGTYSDHTPSEIDYQFSGGGTLTVGADLQITPVTASSGNWSITVTTPSAGSYILTITSDPLSILSASVALSPFIVAVPSLDVDPLGDLLQDRFVIITGTYTNYTPTTLSYQFTGGTLTPLAFSITPTDANNGTWLGSVRVPVAALGATQLTIFSTSSTASADVTITTTVVNVTVVLPPEITLNAIGSEPINVPFFITGTYSNGTPLGLKYRFGMTGILIPVSQFQITGTDTWSAKVTAPSIVGTYPLVVRTTNAVFAVAGVDVPVVASLPPPLPPPLSVKTKRIGAPAGIGAASSQPQLIQFTPSVNRGPPLTFKAVLDGSTYTVFVRYLAFGQRFYISCFNSNNVMVFSEAMVGSDDPMPIADLYTSISGLATATLIEPHLYPIGSVVSLLVWGVAPSFYNGLFSCDVVDQITLSYQLPSTSSQPPPATVFGQAQAIENFAVGSFKKSVMFFWQTMSQLVVFP